MEPCKIPDICKSGHPGNPNGVFDNGQLSNAWLKIMKTFYI